jgi:hypothetical protein
MLILTCKVRPAITAALKAAADKAERTLETAYNIRHSDALPEVEAVTGAHAHCVVDLEHFRAKHVLEQIAAHPQETARVSVTLVPAPQPAFEDQLSLFSLGKLPFCSLTPVETAQSVDYWHTRMESQLGSQLVLNTRQRFTSFVYTYRLPELALGLMDHVGVCTVKTLASRFHENQLMPRSMAANRKRLWQEFLEAGLTSPESALYAVRLFFLKEILNSERWSYRRTARFFGYLSTRQFGRNVVSRYGMSVAEIKAVSDAPILAMVAEGLVGTTAKKGPHETPNWIVMASR